MCQLPSVQLTYEDDLERKNGGPSGRGTMVHIKHRICIMSQNSFRTINLHKSLTSVTSHLTYLVIGLSLLGVCGLRSNSPWSAYVVTTHRSRPVGLP